MVKKSTGGRPRKFTEPSRPITLTLPESTLRVLAGIDADRSRAIVQLTNRALHDAGQVAPPLVEIVEVATNVGLVIVGPNQALRKIPFVHLVEVAPARFVLAFDPGHDFKAFELAVSDLLEDLPEREKEERELVEKLLGYIKDLRKSDRMSMAQILLVRLDTN